jgi:hypothetical protein
MGDTSIVRANPLKSAAEIGADGADANPPPVSIDPPQCSDALA